MRIKTADLRRGAFGKPSVPFLYPEGCTYHHLEGGGIDSDYIALATVRSARRKHLWTIPHLCGDAVIVHVIVEIIPAFAIVSRGTVCTPPCAKCLRKSAAGSFIAVMDIASFATPIFFVRKRNKMPKDERTVRPLDEQGNWQYKTEKKYLCVRNGEEREFTASEFNMAQADGWEKQYPYNDWRKKAHKYV